MGEGPSRGAILPAFLSILLLLPPPLLLLLHNSLPYCLCSMMVL